MKNLLLTISILALITLSSCDHVVFYDFYVANNADSTVHVYLNDTSCIIDKGAQAKLLHIQHIQGNGKPYHWDVSPGVYKMTVIKGNDTSKRDYTKNDAWSFNNKSGNYTATITNSEF